MQQPDQGQGGIDAGALDQQEATWLRTVRNACIDVPCLAAAYTARDQALLDASLRAVSPAAYDETKPYPAPDTALTAARARLGQPCGGPPSKPFPGFSTTPGFMTVIGNGTYIAPLAYQGSRFAFLLTYPGESAGNHFDQCVVSDFVVLPGATQPAQTFLQCSLDMDQSVGFGIRQAGAKGTLYWSIDANTKKLSRVPLGVLGGVSPRCRQPESGE